MLKTVFWALSLSVLAGRFDDDDNNWGCGPKTPGKQQSAGMGAATELVRMAKEQGLALTGLDGLLKQLTKTVIEKALNEEMTENLGYQKHDSVGRESGNFGNGTRGKLF